MAAGASIRNILSERQLAILGELAVASTHLEGTAGSQIALTLRLGEEDAETNITPMNLSTRLEALRKLGLARIKTKRRKEEFQKHIEHLKTLAVQRNTVIHGWWRPKGRMTLFDMMAIWAGRYKPHGVEARNKKRVFNAEKLEELAKELDEGAEKLFRIAVSSWLKNRYQEADLHAVIDD